MQAMPNLCFKLIAFRIHESDLPAESGSDCQVEATFYARGTAFAISTFVANSGDEVTLTNAKDPLMKKLIVILALSTLSSAAFAGSLSLSPGEKAVIRSNSDTTVTCASSQIVEAPKPPPRVEYSFCECKSYNLNGKNVAQAILNLKYSNENSARETLIKQFDNGFGGDGDEKCAELIRTISQCRR